MEKIQQKTQDMGKLLLRIKEISGGNANTSKLISIISTVTDVFLNQKRVNVCEHMVKMASIERLKVPPGVLPLHLPLSQTWYILIKRT